MLAKVQGPHMRGSVQPPIRRCTVQRMCGTLREGHGRTKRVVLVVLCLL